MASRIQNSIDERTTDIADSLNNAKSDITPYEVPPPLIRRTFRRTKALKQMSASLHGLGLDHWLRIVEAAEGRHQGKSKSDKRVRTVHSEVTEISQAHPQHAALVSVPSNPRSGSALSVSRTTAVAGARTPEG